MSAHGDGVKIEYDDGRAYQLRTQELVAGQGMHPQDPATAIKALEGCRVWLRVSGADRQAGRGCSQPQEPHLLRFATHVVILVMTVA